MNFLNDLLKVLFGLREVNDLNLIEDPSVAKAIFDPQLQPLVRKMASCIESIFAGFRYKDSPEFLAELEGKSPAFREMRIRLLTPAKLKDMKRRLGSSIVQILESDEAYSLIPTDSHRHLDELKAIMCSLGR